MTKQRIFSYNQNNRLENISFHTSKINEIDSSKHSLFDIQQDERLEFLSIDKRVEIINSWLIDNNSKYTAFDRRIVENGCKTFSTIKNTITNKEQNVLNLSSNDYLKLTQHKRIKEAVLKAIDTYGFGAGTSPIATGTTRIHRQLEEKIAEFKGCEASLVQSSGYATNLGVISALLGENDIAIFDSYSHASLLDGIKLANTNKVFFLHNDMKSLESMLKRTQDKYVNRIVIVEGLYSMDGDIAPLDTIYMLTRKYGALLLVDDAHATGVLGKNGKGSIELFNLEGKVEIVTGTFSKSIGGVGGFVAGTNELINFLRLSSRSYIFSASAFIPTVAAALEAFKIIEEESNLRDKLWVNTKYMHQKLIESGFNIGDTQTCIFPVFVGNDIKALELTQQLQNSGYLVNPVLYPAVPKDRARIRFAVSSENTFEQLDSFIKIITKIGKELNII